MSSYGEEPTASDWDWISTEEIGCLMFARGVSSERVIEAFGMDPLAAQLLPAPRVNEALRLPVHDQERRVIYPWIRVGRAGEWGFALDLVDYDPRYLRRIAGDLSAATDLVMLQWTPTIDYFHYLVDNTEVTAFEPLMARDRFGTQPDRFLREMREVGLTVDDQDPEDEFDDEPPPTIRALQMLTTALGIRLPGEVALGPLLTVQRGDQVPPGSRVDT